MDIKGWMIDAARLPEPLPQYRRVIDLCAEWGFNTVLFRLADDQGSALRFCSHPELITHPHAFTGDELTDLAHYALERGVQLIPEIESFGHTGYITRSPQHSSLIDRDTENGSPYTGVIPNYPDTLSLLADLYREVAEIFPSPYLHAGCDEVNWGGSAYSQAAIAARGRPAVWADYLNRLNDIARGLGKELMIWADHVLGEDPEQQKILEALSRQVILVDWNYWDSDPCRSDGLSKRPGTIESRARSALEQGFRLVGAPAYGWCRWGVRVGESQLRNIDAYADIYRALPEPGCLGVIVTHWVPTRFIPNSWWDGLAYAGVALNEGSSAAHLIALPRFVQKHYWAEWDEGWTDLFHSLYAATPPRRTCAPEWMAPFQPPVWADRAGLDELLAGETPPFAVDLPWARLRSQLATCGGKVQRNLTDFRAFALALEYLEHIHRRCTAVLEAHQNPRKRTELLGDIAQRDEALAEAMLQAWDEARFPDDPAKETLLADLSLEDQPLLAMRRASAFSKQLIHLGKTSPDG